MHPGLSSKLKVAEDKLQDFIQEAEVKIEEATEEMEKTRKSASSDIARLEAAVKKSDLRSKVYRNHWIKRSKRMRS